jgi:EAL domain-containing protein (putative c-di-GMP-specific phosphodiesterase class I)
MNNNILENKSILILDDEIGIVDLIADLASEMGCTSIIKVINSNNFVSQYTDEIDFIFLDLYMPETDGIEILHFLGESNSTASIVLMSGVDEKVLQTAVIIARSYGLNIVGTLTKPIPLHQLEYVLSEPKNFSKKVFQKSDRKIDKSDLERALESNEELVLFYQPQIQIQKQRFYGFEALIRWKHPEYGLIFPDQFISLAEESNLIKQLTWYVIKTTIKTLLDWRKEGYEIRVSINVSVDDLQDLNFPQLLYENMKVHNLSPYQITLELTESKLMGDDPQSLEILTRLRMKGFEISIDDFGTGYSSLEQLSRVPFNELKVDKSFVLDCLHNPDSRTIVESTIQMAHNMGLTVVAEGIESKAILKYIKSLGCEVGQGYVFSPALNYMDALNFIKNINLKEYFE